MQLASAKKTVFRRDVQGLPSGTVEVPRVSSDGSWAECLRDVTRMVHGKAVYIMGPNRICPLQAEMKTAGDVSYATCEAAFDSLMRAVCNEITTQGAAQATSTEAPATSFHSSPWREEPESVCDWQPDSLALKELTRQVATHISIGPGMEVVLQEKLPPALWQPTFVICISQSQVRVLTFAFVGEPATGNRPERKNTPFMLQMLTDSITAPAPQPRPDESVTWVPASTVAVKYKVEFVHAPLVLDHILGKQELLWQQVWGET